MHYNNFTVFITFLVFLINFSVYSYSQQTVWSNTYGGPGSVNEQGVDILQTFDNSYVVLSTKSYGDSYTRIQLIKLDALGNVLWEKITGDSTIEQIPYSFQQTKDSGFIITGISGSAFLIKTDKFGNQQWKKIYNTTYAQTYSNFVGVTDDNGYIFCGSASFLNPPSDKGYIVKTNKLGEVQWEKIYTDSLFTAFSDITLSSDGHYYVTGGTYNVDPITYYTVVKKTDLEGNVSWTKTYAQNYEGANILLLDANSLIVNARKQYNSSSRILRLDNTGELIWDITLLEPNFSTFHSAICKDDNNNIQKVGNINSRIAYTEISALGSQISLNPYNSTGVLGSYGSVIKNCDDKGFIIVGTVSTGTQTNPRYDVLVIKTDSSGHAPLIVHINKNNSLQTYGYKLSQNFPNPFNPSTNISFALPRKEHVLIRIYNSIGQEISTLVNQEFDQGEHLLTYTANDLPTGLYFYKLHTSTYTETKKMFLLK